MIVLVVLVALGVALLLAQNRKRDQQREQAAVLRQEATAHVADHAKSEAAAREKAADAERARAEAERLEAEAAERQRALDVDRARHEDTLREADRLDPDVDTKHPDYTPGAGAPTTNESTATGSTENRADHHRTDPPGRPQPGRPQPGDHGIDHGRVDHGRRSGRASCARPGDGPGDRPHRPGPAAAGGRGLGHASRLRHCARSRRQSPVSVIAAASSRP